MLFPLLGLCPTTAWCWAELSLCGLSSQLFAASSNMASSMSSSAVKDLSNISMMFLWLGSWTNPNIRFKTTDMRLVKLCKIRFVLAGLKWMCLIHVKKKQKNMLFICITCCLFQYKCIMYLGVEAGVQCVVWEVWLRQTHLLQDIHFFLDHWPGSIHK